MRTGTDTVQLPHYEFHFNKTIMDKRAKGHSRIAGTGCEASPPVISGVRRAVTSEERGQRRLVNGDVATGSAGISGRDGARECCRRARRVGRQEEGYSSEHFGGVHKCWLVGDRSGFVFLSF